MCTCNVHAGAYMCMYMHVYLWCEQDGVRGQEAVDDGMLVEVGQGIQNLPGQPAQ